jgi:hypothetical protein
MPPRAHRSDAACPRGICRTPAIPLHGTAFEERMDYRTRTDVRRHFRKRGATPSHLCPNARIAGVIRLAWRPGFFAAQNSYACASGPSKARGHSAPHVDRPNRVQLVEEGGCRVAQLRHHAEGMTLPRREQWPGKERCGELDIKTRN